MNCRMAIKHQYVLISVNYEMLCLKFFCQGQPTNEIKLELFFLSFRASLGLKVITKLLVSCMFLKITIQSSFTFKSDC